jgi:hypothetical protein
MQPWGKLPSRGGPAAFPFSGLRPVALRPNLSGGLPFTSFDYLTADGHRFFIANEISAY